MFNLYKNDFQISPHFICKVQQQSEVIIQMETQEVKLEEIQASNEAARKKLEGFKSGLERLINKKSKKSSQHQPPSHDTKSPINAKKQANYFSTNSANSATSQLPSLQPTTGNEFGFNSTLFRQIADDTAILSNPSGLLSSQAHQKFAYNSVPSGTEYFSTSSQQSRNIYEPHIEIKGSQNFAKASKLFSEVDDLINKNKKTAKLPVKPIQKYFDKIEQNLSMSNVEDLDISLDKPGLKLDKGIKLSPRKQVKPTGKLGLSEDKNDEMKFRSMSAKDEIKSATQFLKNYKVKPEFMKAPPLPPQMPKQDINKRLSYQQTQSISQSDKFIKTVPPAFNEIQIQPRQSLSKSPTKQILGQNSVQIHKNKLKQALSERKKMIKDDGLMDDSIELELSQDEHDSFEESQKEDYQQKKHREQDIRKLQRQKEELLKELQQVEEELERLENE